MSKKLIKSTQEVEHNREPHVVDRSGWPQGPWDNEPEDYVQWRYKGHPCLAVRNDLGNWCFYAGVYPDHLAYGSHYDDVDVSTHGGLTYSGACRGNICHTPEPGEPPVHWLGADCAHAGDLVPGMLKYHQRAALSLGYEDNPLAGDVYRTLGYVHRECEELVDQLIVLTPEQVTDNSEGRDRSKYWWDYSRAEHKKGRSFDSILEDYERVMAEYEAHHKPKLLN